MRSPPRTGSQLGSASATALTTPPGARRNHIGAADRSSRLSNSGFVPESGSFASVGSKPSDATLCHTTGYNRNLGSSVRFFFALRSHRVRV